ncbi:MAG: NAD-dependent epimerase/dehydratase family protein, partial [Verrucomicrobia bacterium]|nr:NAD-dependent epimerase/dehydratase family protein [Verrucomicrobiota bacterium]
MREDPGPLIRIRASPKEFPGPRGRNPAGWERAPGERCGVVSEGACAYSRGMSETILVTGGCGFIGSNYVRHLLGVRPQAKAVVLDKLTYAGHRPNLEREEKAGGCEVVVGDIADAGLVEKLLEKHRPVSIVNFAAESHVDRSIDEPAPFLHTNVTGTFVMLEATRKYLAGRGAPEKGLFRFVHLSTDEVHGSLELSDPPFRETSTFA